MKRKYVLASIGSVTGVLIVLGIVIALNVVFGSVRLRKDMTEEKIYTLSDGTQTLLANMRRDVTLKLFFSKSNENVPIALKQYAQRVEDLLQEYKRVGHGHIIVETYDPKPDSDEEEWAQRYGLTAQALGMMGVQPDLYFGLVAVSGTKEMVLPFLSPDAEPQLEYFITRLIYEVTRAHKPRLGIISALDVMGAPQMPYGTPREDADSSWKAIGELKKQYDVVPLDLKVERIPSSIDALVLIHPRNLSDQTLFAIDQFVLHGGRLLVFEDPLCLTERESEPSPSPYGGMSAASDINKLTKAWGVEMMPGQVVADLDAASQVSFGARGSERLPTWLTLRKDNIDRKEIVTSSLDSLMMPFAGAFKLQLTNGVRAVKLVYTSDDASLINSFQAAQAGVEKMRGAKPEGQVALALRLEGTFKTAFPDGPPVSLSNQTEKVSSDASDAYLKESEKNGVVVLVSDVDMLNDRFALRKTSFFGQTFYQPINDNLNFALNLVEQLAGSDALIGLRSRGTYSRPFDKVVELERQAQQKWQEEELELVSKLKEAQMRLNALQRTKSEDQQYILSPEQKKEIENFRQQKFDTQRQLKEVRKNLRRDIEQLGLKLKIINIAMIPLLVAAFGLFHGWRRKRRASSV